MTKLLSDYQMTDEELLRRINDMLSTSYDKLSRVPLDALRRVWIILEITYLINTHNVKVFMCEAEDIHDTANN